LHRVFDQFEEELKTLMLLDLIDPWKYKPSKVSKNMSQTNKNLVQAAIIWLAEM